MNHTRTVTIADNELEVSFDYYPPSRGARERGTGLQLEPDEPATFEICEVKLGEHDVTELVEPYMDKIEQQISESEMD